MVHEMTVTLEELYNGATRKLALQKHVICSKCEGVGGKKPPERCPNCKGSGMQVSCSLSKIVSASHVWCRLYIFLLLNYACFSQVWRSSLTPFHNTCVY